MEGKHAPILPPSNPTKEATDLPKDFEGERRSRGCWRPRRHALIERAAGRPVPVPSLGYVAKDRLRYRFADREEIFEAGDAFYLPPGHIPCTTSRAASSC